MKRRHLLSLLPASAVLALSPPPVAALEPPAPEPGGHEEPPVLRAADILQPAVLAGARHRVREEVPTYAGVNWYIIDSDAGTFQAAGNAMLEERVREIYAILALREISRGKEYGEAVKRAAKSPFVMAKNLIKNPVDTVVAVPKGVFKMVKRTGRALESAGGGQEKNSYTDNEAAALLGVSKAKRELAFQYGVNPYSSNPVLQKELNSLGWTSFAGNASVAVLTAGIGGGVAATMKVTGVFARNAQRLRDTSPVDLRSENKKALLSMGVNDALAEYFLGNPALSPSHQLNVVTSLESLTGLAGRADFLRLAAGTAEDETDAVFFEQTANLLARVHQESIKLKALAVLDGLPTAIAQNGVRVVALHWDYAAWTARAAEFLHDLLQPPRGEAGPPKLAVMLTGQVSPLLRRELEARRVQVFDRVVPGPLR